MQLICGGQGSVDGESADFGLQGEICDWDVVEGCVELSTCCVVGLDVIGYVTCHLASGNRVVVSTTPNRIHWDLGSRFPRCFAIN